MADQPIGISFIPSAQNMANGPQAASAQGEIGSGPNTDLAQAYKILSLRLPSVVGAQAPVKQSLLTSPGASGLSSLPGGMNPYAAAFQSLIRAMMGDDPYGMAPMGASSESSASPGRASTHVIFNEPGGRDATAGSNLPGAMSSPPTGGNSVPSVQNAPSDPNIYMPGAGFGNYY